jgi:Family of unknown function (DUF6491)
MKTRTLWTFSWFSAVLLVACTTPHPKDKPADAAGKVTPQMRAGSNELRAYQLLEWIAPDDHNLIVNAVDRSLYHARFKRQCTGLRSVDTVAFIVSSPPLPEKTEGIVLPNGTRCVFTSLTKLDTGPDK